MVTQENYHVGTSQLFVFLCCVVLFCLVWVFFGGGMCLFVCGFSSHSRTVHSYGEVTITGEGLQIFIYYHFSNSETLRFSGLKISHDDHIIKPTTGSSISMTFAYQTKTEQYNDQSHFVCVEHGSVVNKTHTSIQKTVLKKSI